jgi:hypothetical protein
MDKRGRVSYRLLPYDANFDNARRRLMHAENLIII